MKCFYDFHIHSCLSPCGDMDMTPNNIVNMSLIKGLDAIAVTDHNCAANMQAVLRCAHKKLTVLCGMELESCEEVHMVCLFSNYDACHKMEQTVFANMNVIKNNTEIFGSQIIMNENDEEVGQVENLLVTATSLSVYDILELTHEFGGVCIAAHVDKSSYSVLSNLGFIPDDLAIDCIEISKNGDYDELVSKQNYLKQYKSVFSSDAHYLTDISERVNFIETDDFSAEAVLRALRQK